jgi:rfaE bifunctional protein nucleotidyltransferase chain/domain
VAQIVSPEALLDLRTEWRRNAMRAVLAVGAFDLLHPGHVRLLEQARSLGDVLVVAVENDGAVRAAAEKELDKAPAWTVTRHPVVPLSERAEILAALAAVDFVAELQDVSAEAWIERFQPDIYVQGRTKTPRSGAVQLTEKAAVKGWNTVNIPLEPGYSTAALIERIQHLKQ